MHGFLHAMWRKAQRHVCRIVFKLDDNYDRAASS